MNDKMGIFHIDLACIAVYKVRITILLNTSNVFQSCKHWNKHFTRHMHFSFKLHVYNIKSHLLPLLTTSLNMVSVGRNVHV
jgi:hypothetical protein